MAQPSTALLIGKDLSTQLVEQPGSPERIVTLDKDQVIRKYKCRYGSVLQLLPLMGTVLPDYTGAYLIGFRYNRTGETDLCDVTLTYEANAGTTILNPDAPLPPDEVEYIAATTERHLSAHPSYNANWLGNPKTDGVIDPRGAPTTTPTKLGVENYLIPTGIYRRVSYTHTQPKLNIATIATRNIPPGESGANKWLQTGYTLRITKGVYQLSEEWMFLPIGTWDTDIYS